MWRRLIRRLIDRRVRETPISKHTPPKYKEIPALPNGVRRATEVPVGPGTIPAYILNDADELIPYAEQVLQQRSFELARALFKRAIDLQPARVDAHNYLGVTYYALGETGKALYWFRSAIQLNPDYLETYPNLIWLYGKLGSFTEEVRLSEMYTERARDDRARQKQIHKILANMKNR